MSVSSMSVSGMNKRFDITRTEITMVHNATFYLGHAVDRIKDGESASGVVLQQLEHALKYLQMVRDPLLRQVDDANDLAREYYEGARKENELRAIWSYYDIADVTKTSTVPVGGVLKSPYTKRMTAVQGPTWLDFWKAVDLLVRDANDNHVFIEGFTRRKDGTFLVELGS